MTLALSALIAIAVLISVVLIYLEHEWGVLVAGLTIATLTAGYFLAQWLSLGLRKIFPTSSWSALHLMIMTTGALLVIMLAAITYLALRKRTSRNQGSGK